MIYSTTENSLLVFNGLFQPSRAISLGRALEDDAIQEELPQSLSRAQVVAIPVQGFSQESDAPLPSQLPTRTYRKPILRWGSLEKDALTRVQGSRIVTRSRAQMASAAATKKKKKG
ncbi:hypothetical protein PG997_006089 [Apiospora hydei]|uniref:Uncharacterized protein n=1 Tax=Apiospora hydei TaxID=1337664 RepID=A0ABR1WN11_9PEZI